MNPFISVIPSCVIVLIFCRVSSQPSAPLSYTRKVASADVRSLAGVPSDLRLTSYEKEDRVSFDTRNIVRKAQGSMSMSLASLSGSSSAARSSQPASLSVASKRIIGSAPAAGARRKRRWAVHTCTVHSLSHVQYSACGV